MLKDALQKLDSTPLFYSKVCFFYEKVSSFEPTFKGCQQWISLLIMRILTHRWLAGEGWWKNCWILDLFFFGSAGVRSRLKMSKTDLPQTRICNCRYVVAGYVCRKSLAISKTKLFARLGMIFEIQFPSYSRAYHPTYLPKFFKDDFGKGSPTSHQGTALFPQGS